ncbi:hypothetical protein ABPG75_010732 [Micractinium tetrahymenae]
MRLPAAASSGKVRLPVAADKYYSADPAVLRQQLDACLAAPAPPVVGSCLQAAQRGPGGRARRLAGLIVPHGALQDSGMVAAAAYSLLATQLGHSSSSSSSSSSLGGASSPPAAAAGPPQPARLVLLGTNHFTRLPPACLSSAAAWRTPLGDVPVDPPLTAALAAQGICFDDAPHNLEHSIENQLCFLQHTLGASRPPGIAPVCVGWLVSVEAARRLARQLTAVLRQAPAAVLVATSDFTHAGPSYHEPAAAPWMTLREHCLWRDSPLIHAACQGSPGRFLDACNATGSSLCGRWPVAAFMGVAEELGWSIELLSYAPSDLYVQTGDVNGFAAFAAWE